MRTKKIVGWTLLIAGLLLISWTLFSTYNIFTAEKEPPEIFNPEIFNIEGKQGLSREEGLRDLVSEEEFSEEISRKIEEEIRTIIPSEILSKLLNLISWSVFSGILIFGGSRLAGIGIKLIKGE